MIGRDTPAGFSGPRSYSAQSFRCCSPTSEKQLSVVGCQRSVKPAKLHQALAVNRQVGDAIAVRRAIHHREHGGRLGSCSR